MYYKLIAITEITNTENQPGYKGSGEIFKSLKTKYAVIGGLIGVVGGFLSSSIGTLMSHGTAHVQADITDFKHQSGLLITGALGYVFGRIWGGNEMQRQADNLELMQSEIRHREFIEKAVVGIYQISKDGQFLMVNKKLEEILGYNSEEFLSDNIKATDLYVSPEDRNLLLAEIEETGFLKDRIFQFKRKGGQLIWIKINAREINDHKGNMILECFLEDITEHKRLEDKLKASLADIRNFVDNAVVAIFTTNSEGKFTAANKKTSELTGYTIEELLSKEFNIRDMYKHPEERVDIIKELKETGVLNDKTIEFTKKNGESFWLRTHVKVRINKEGTKLFDSVMEDVTESKLIDKLFFEKEAEHKASEQINELAGGLAHDFNNLLAQIQGFANLLKDDLEGQESLLEDLNVIINASKEATALVKKIKSISKSVESRDSMIVKVNQSIKEIEPKLKKVLGNKIGLKITLSKDDLKIKSGMHHLRDILNNIVINAMESIQTKESHDAQINIITSQVVINNSSKNQYGLNNGEYVYLKISDTGPGMSKDVLKNIFTPYFSTKKRTVAKGMGFGLTQVKKWTEMYGGEIRVDSNATVRMFFPLIKEDIKTEIGLSETPKLARELKNGIPQGRGETILVVDDESSLREIASAFLKKNKFKTLIASNGQEALKIYEENKSKIAMILLDIQMPVMDGLECLKKLLIIDPKVKVVIATGNAGVTQVNNAKNVLNKPYQKEDLWKTACDVIDKE